jgi:transposase-like protein
VKYPLSLRNVEDLLAERGIDMRALSRRRQLVGCT